MQFDGGDLLAILCGQGDAIDVRDGNGGLKSVPVALAVKALDLRGYVGVGNKTRIRYLRPIPGRWQLNSGSQFTRPSRADGTGPTYGCGQLLGNSRTNREFTPDPRR
jgi:hypothetical protein